MRGDAGVGGDEQRLSQIVWILFLKIFDYQEEEWELTQDNYARHFSIFSWMYSPSL